MQQIGRATQDITQITQQITHTTLQINETTRQSRTSQLQQIQPIQQIQQTQRTQQTLQLLAFMLIFKLMRSAANQQRQGQNQLFDDVTLSGVAEPTTGPPLPSSQSFIVQHSTSAPPADLPPLSDVAASFHVPSDPPATSQLSSPAAPDAPPPDAPYDTLLHAARYIPRVPYDDSRCPRSCCCCCHHMVQATPQFLTPLLGNLYLQSALLLSLFTATTCNDPACRRTRETLLAVKWQLPTWFFAVDAKLRIDAIPIHVCIQTPRVLENLDLFLWRQGCLRVDDMQKMLSSKQITLNDVDVDGRSVLHVRVYINISRMHALTMVTKFLFDRVTSDLEAAVTLDTIQFVIEAGAPAEWTQNHGL